MLCGYTLTNMYQVIATLHPLEQTILKFKQTHIPAFVGRRFGPFFEGNHYGSLGQD